ncbi:anaerobic ribonucleoside-triphosphate reductase activating protein [Paenibacillus sp. EKM102P]|uniref:anaerobic ribonucleoside-triphosphate reductase activating protein n=1 Tax=unclassified Paenibacillus TaxID=185978 RepID=UPI00142E07A3|nr:MULTISPECIES: anaerobic ribonucleoside-triphosphate reductase activating protein [unclassified Paenibacillus]KAF6620591.1 anaerobic ribonucleoside-triphosphate reductase activating protein [Paenibacillus sp. EKM101P]KAF6623584.1 anaerobic ribonucleoside-triphosphate reductase activating protein [Paenibacillus sp. EKM102P]KAF6633855.1 anaerobic ribonucleoside-triphosphate reductase activating protein [Paenibacillus sp. EKM10P]KAF6649380.1 anaerobic ribonucleoside-triphosphate reductase activa
MYIADYKRFDVINGIGLRHSLFVSGCAHHCKGCFNVSAWNSHYGIKYTDELENKIISDLKIDYVQIAGLSVLGGEPFQSIDGLLPLLKRVKNECEDKTIWIWSGYTFEKIMENQTMKELMLHCDILVDGRFELSKRDLNLKWRGSSNQRIIDIQRSLSENKAVLFAN